MKSISKKDFLQLQIFFQLLISKLLIQVGGALEGKKCIDVSAGTTVSFAVTEKGECYRYLIIIYYKKADLVMTKFE